MQANFVFLLYIRKIGDVVWLLWDNHPLNAKQQTTKLLQRAIQSSMMGKTHTIKNAVKGPKINNVKLFIKDKNWPNL